MNERSIRTVAVIGDGIAGWLAVCALATRLPHCSVAIIRVENMREGMADLFGATTPAASEFHSDIGLDEQLLLRRAGAVARLGTRFSGAGFPEPTLLGYDRVGAGIGSGHFASVWPEFPDVGSYASFSPAAQLAANRKLPSQDPIFSTVGAGLQLDPLGYRAFLAAFGQHCGVRIAKAPMQKANIEGQRIASISLSDGTELRADLYINAANGAAKLFPEWGAEREDWTHWLPFSQVSIEEAPQHSDTIATCDNCEATADGWRTETELPRVIRRARIWAGDGHSSAPLSFPAGRVIQPWIGNAVSIGDAHGMISPIAALPLHILYTQIDRIIASLPDREYARCEIDYYNHEANAELDRLRDFAIALHLPWLERQELPTELTELISLFRERGRILLRDGEGFSRDIWSTLLFGLGFSPRRSDMLAVAAPPEHVRQEMRHFLAQLEAATQRAPVQKVQK
ncbi:hypothetical protein GRI39_11710 [Altererythrobacter indicus]|uniref:Tryptophan halogenase n=1 Tax=Altericroceibacterium indicum TaxID=374177 RepID=A0A845ACI1_9SPHN|nr:tryptophan 7-halogenase [Altericroceibacterium indicum]MXP26701.1 hypothetical protein [Altericroceibacterium indicum]